MAAGGAVLPTGGVLTAFEPPNGPGLRTDTFGLRRLPDESTLRLPAGQGRGASATGRPRRRPARTARALGDFRIEGIETNASFLRALLTRPEAESWNVHTRFVDERLAELVEEAARIEDRGYQAGVADNGGSAGAGRGLAGVKVDAVDPLAVLDHGKSGGPAVSVPAAAPPQVDSTPVPEGLTAVRAPMQGTVLSHEAEPGQEIAPGQILFIMEAMKMEHEIRSDIGGVLRDLRAASATRSGRGTSWR